MTTPTTPHLPIPDLEETIQRYLRWVKPLLDEETYLRTEEVTTHFLSNEGPELQHSLQHFAQSLPHGNWLIDKWLDGYLSERRPLPLASNVGFAINTHHELHHWLHALAATCADYLHDRITTPTSPQGNPVCREQWKVLLGSTRRPQHHSDSYHFAKHSRHIGIFQHGLYYRIAALDEAGEALSADYFAKALSAIRSCSDTAAYPVAVPTFLGSDKAAEVLESLTESSSHNDNLLKDIEADLFHVCLDNSHSDDPATNLARATFLPTQPLWCYKPLTLWHNESHHDLILHVEHTWLDGGAVVGIISHAKTLLDQQSGGSEPLHIKPRQWHLHEKMQHQWPQWFEEYYETASQMCVTIHRYPLPQPVPQGISQDALMQFALQYAQLTIFGKIRNTYEAVDVSHFQRGRTECIRPVSTESAALVFALFKNQANTELLQAALAEHKARIKACKTGHGINRHLLGLAHMAQTNGIQSTLFTSPAYQTICRDFLSTSTLGNDAIIHRFAFAPTSEDGFGVNYTIIENGWEFTLCYPKDQLFTATALSEAIQEAIEKLFHLLTSN